MMQGIYAITCTANGHKYVGSAKNFHARWLVHRRELEAGRHTNPHLQNSWSKYGESMFLFEVLEELPLPYNRAFFFERENHHIDTTPQVFNIRRAGGGGWDGLSADEIKQVKEKISASMRNVKKSDETRAKMKAAQRERSRTDPTLARNMASVGRLNIGKTPVNAVKFMVHGVTYPSGKAAERGLGITSRQLAKLVEQGKAYRV